VTRRLEELLLDETNDSLDASRTGNSSEPAATKTKDSKTRRSTESLISGVDDVDYDEYQISSSDLDEDDEDRVVRKDTTLTIEVKGLDLDALEGGVDGVEDVKAEKRSNSRCSTAWESWFVKKEEERRLEEKRKKTLEAEKREEDEQARKEEEKKKKAAEEKIKTWMAEKEESEAKEVAARQRKEERKERRETKKAKETNRKSKEKFDEWLEGKKKREREGKREQQRKAALETEAKERRRKEAEAAFDKWKAATANSAGRRIDYFDWRSKRQSAPVAVSGAWNF